MKNTSIKFYIISFFLMISMNIAAQAPGDTDGTPDGLEGADPPAAPLDHYILPMALIAVLTGYKFSNKNICKTN